MTLEEDSATFSTLEEEGDPATFSSLEEDVCIDCGSGRTAALSPVHATNAIAAPASAPTAPFFKTFDILIFKNYQKFTPSDKPNK